MKKLIKFTGLVITAVAMLLCFTLTASATENVFIEEDTELSGALEEDNFIIREGVTVIVPEGETLVAEKGSSLSNDGIFIIYGTFINNTVIIVNGTFENHGTLINNYTILNNTGIQNSGVIENHGTMRGNGNVTNIDGGTFLGADELEEGSIDDDSETQDSPDIIEAEEEPEEPQEIPAVTADPPYAETNPITGVRNFLVIAGLTVIASALAVATRLKKNK